MTFKIYTKTGDTGQTSLIGGIRVPKYHLRIEAYGTVDELNSHLGLLKDNLLNNKHQTQLLAEVQDRLFTIGSILASEPESKMKLPGLKESDIELLEEEMDNLDQMLPPLKSFILPGGNALGSQCHIARCVCRRAERIVVQLATETEIDALIVKYLNRLSDFLFVLSRKIVLDNNGVEVLWKPRV
jgi:cob(I)alamin adenosyltransferase